MDVLQESLKLATSMLEQMRGPAGELITSAFKPLPGTEGIIPSILSRILNATISALALWSALPTIKTLFQKAPTLLGDLTSSILEVTREIGKYAKKLILEKTPHIAHTIISPRYYGNVLLWCAASDIEAMLICTKNSERTHPRLLTPYHSQLTLGLSVLALSIWSCIGIALTLYISMTGDTKLDLSALAPSQAFLLTSTSLIFGILIFCLDRSLVSSTKQSSQLIARIFISLIVASWVSTAFTILVFEEKVRDAAKTLHQAEYQKTLKEKSAYEQGIQTLIKASETESQNCKNLQDDINRLNKSLTEETHQACPKGKETNCIGPEYTKLTNQQQSAVKNFEKSCKQRDKTESEGEIIKQYNEKLARIAAAEKDGKIDIFTAIQALANIEDTNKSDKNFIFQWIKFPPNLTFLIFICIDLIPLIIKMFCKCSYHKQLSEIENDRSLASKPPPNHHRLRVWNPISGDQKDEKRWHI